MIIFHKSVDDELLLRWRYMYKDPDIVACCRSRCDYRYRTK